MNHKHNRKPSLRTAATAVTVVGLVLGLLNVIVSNQLSTEGRAMAETSSEIIKLEKEVLYLEQQIAAESALAHIDQRASELGFRGVDAPLALNPSEPVALVW